MKLTANKTGALKGEVRVPSDKSISHRALILGSQGMGKSRISGLLEGEDVLNTGKALQTLGVEIENTDKGSYTINGLGVGGLQAPTNIIDCGNSGTGVRLLMGLVSSYEFDTIFTGDDSLRSRPMRRVMTPLEKMGVNFEAQEGGRLPLTAKGFKDIMPIEYELPVASAQVKSAILLAGLNTDGITSVIEPKPTRDHTELMLQSMGADIKTEGNKISIKGYQHLEAQEFDVPADPSSAAFLAVAALISEGSEVLLKDICINKHRVGLYITLQEMGGDITFLNERKQCGENVADILVKSSALKGISVPAERAPSMIDEYPILSVACSYASGTSKFNGIEELKVKESNRLQAVYDGIIAIGVEAEMGDDYLIIQGGGSVAGGCEIETHHDHRIAMSFLIAGLKSEKPITVNNAQYINTSFPDFVGLMNRIGANIS